MLRPVEGTILTVARAMAEAGEALVADGASPELVDVLDGLSVAARDAVERTPELLPVLAEAGVVDAGGKGLALFVDALLKVVDGRPVPEPEVVATPAAVAAHLRGEDVSSLRYEVMYLLEADDATVPAFRQAWAAIGDSIVVVGGDGLYNCHVHTNDIGAAVEAGIQAGRPRDIRVTDLVEQVEEEAWVRAGGPPGERAAEPVTTAVVAVAVGDGNQRLLRSLGVQGVVAGGQSMNPSTAQILEAVEACPSDQVVVLPDNKNIIAVARQVDGLTAKHVAVVPTTAVVEALSALVAYDPGASLEANVGGMQEAAARVRSGEVTRAVRDSVAECGAIREGDWIALDRTGVCATAPTAVEAVTTLVDRLVDEDCELVTVLVGADADPGETARLEEHLALAHPHVELEVHEGGQPLYPYLVGVE
ncbi:MAG: DAK2 domain-containing protein [Acidimicrobiia bacterium]|nr:DAK2 domain-containing protein [Acidimicrobiia bacterium]